MQQPPPLPAANPYAAPIARVQDVRDADSLELADRGTRLGAAILDGLVIGGPMWIVVIGAAIALPAFNRGNGDESLSLAFAIAGIVLLVLAVGLVALNLVWLHRYGQSLAKRWLGIRIVRTDGSRCSLLRIIFARGLPVVVLRMIPLLGYVFMLLDPLMIFRDDYRCLHDHIADTIVVKA